MEQHPRIKINPISNRQYILSPSIENGEDRECTNKDFYQETPDPIDIGKLGFGIRVTHRKTNSQYIIINFEKGKVSKANLQQKINSTLELMYNSASNYLLRLLNHYEDENNIFLILEGYNGDTLENKIINNQIDLENSLKIFYQVCRGVIHLQSFKMANISVIPENILITKNGNIKLTDYGLKMSSRNPNKKPVRPTKYLKIGNSQYNINAYTTPEELNALRNRTRPNLTTKTDSWNLGILLYEMLTNFKSPFRSGSIDEIAESILKCEIDLSAIQDPFCKELIGNLVKLNPEERIGIESVLQMDKFANFEDLDEQGVDMNECIINPDDEGYQPNVAEANYDYDNSMMQSLQFENENLKKKIEELELKMNSNLSNSIGDELNGRKSKKPRKTKSKKKSIITDNLETDGAEKEGETKILTEKDLEMKEKMLDEKLKQLEESEEEDEDEDENENDLSNDLSDEDDENFTDKDNEVALRSKYRKLKNKFELLKSEYKSSVEKTKSFGEQMSKLQKEKYELEEKLKIGSFEKIDNLNSTNINNLTELNDKLNNAIQTFFESQTSFRELVEKLIKMSNEEHELLMKENKTYINEKQKIFFDILKKIKSNNIDQDKENNLRKSYKEQIEDQQKKIDELMNFKMKYQQKEAHESGYLQQLQLLTESDKINKEQIETYEKQIKELLGVLDKTKNEKANLELKLSDAKNFVGKHCEGALVEEFFKQIGV